MCYCGQTSETVPSTNCNVKCIGDTTQFCGGDSEKSVNEINGKSILLFWWAINLTFV